MRDVARTAVAISNLARYDRPNFSRNTRRRQIGLVVTESAYSIYLVRCNDGSLYTGIATDVERRIREHAESSKGAKFLRGKSPLTLVFQRKVGDRSLATKVEMQVKKLPRGDKSNMEVLSARIDDLLANLDAASTDR